MCHVGDGARRPRPQHYVSEHPVRCCPRAHPGPRPSPRHARGCPSCFFEARRAHTFFLTGFVSAMVSVGERTGLREGHGGQGSARTSAYGRGSPRPRGRKTRASRGACCHLSSWCSASAAEAAEGRGLESARARGPAPILYPPCRGVSSDPPRAGERAAAAASAEKPAFSFRPSARTGQHTLSRHGPEARGLPLGFSHDPHGHRRDGPRGAGHHQQLHWPPGSPRGGRGGDQGARAEEAQRVRG